MTGCSMACSGLARLQPWRANAGPTQEDQGRAAWGRGEPRSSLEHGSRECLDWHGVLRLILSQPVTFE